MANKAFPTETEIIAKESEGYRLLYLENVGMGIMEPCSPGDYNDPDVMIINKETRTATLLFI